MRGFSRQSVSRDLSRDLSTNDGFGPGDSPPPGEPFVPISFVSKGMSPATKQAIERIEKRLETSVAQSHAERTEMLQVANIQAIEAQRQRDVLSQQMAQMADAGAAERRSTHELLANSAATTEANALAQAVIAEKQRSILHLQIQEAEKRSEARMQTILGMVQQLVQQPAGTQQNPHIALSQASLSQSPALFAAPASGSADTNQQLVHLLTQEAVEKKKFASSHVFSANDTYSPETQSTLKLRLPGKKIIPTPRIFDAASLQLQPSCKRVSTET